MGGCTACIANTFELLMALALLNVMRWEGLSYQTADDEGNTEPCPILEETKGVIYCEDSEYKSADDSTRNRWIVGPELVLCWSRVRHDILRNRRRSKIRNRLD